MNTKQAYVADNVHTETARANRPPRGRGPFFLSGIALTIGDVMVWKGKLGLSLTWTSSSGSILITLSETGECSSLNLNYVSLKEQSTRHTKYKGEDLRALAPLLHESRNVRI